MLGLLFFFGLSTGAGLRFDLDWAVFAGPADSARVEFYYGIPYDQLTFQPGEDGLTCFFSVGMQMKGLDNNFYESGEIRKRARIRNFQDAVQGRRSFVDQFSIVCPAGRYEIRATIADSLHSGERVDTITVQPLSSIPGDRATLSGARNAPTLSSIELASAVLRDTISGSFAVVPNPGRRFLRGTRRLFAYFEGYALIPDSGTYEVRYRILSEEGGDTVTGSQPILRRKTGTKTALVLEMGIDSLEPGGYIFQVELTDHTTHQTSRTTRRFTVVAETPGTSGADAAGEPNPLSSTFHPTAREAPYYTKIEYIATPRELAYYNALSDSGKIAYLAWFWSRHNLTEFVRRMETAEARFRHGRSSGVNTDRGKVYVKYGEPDAVERKTMEMEIKPREYWFYYQAGLTFIFIDLRGDGNYRLAWTNSPDEPPTGLEHLLTPEEQDQFR